MDTPLSGAMINQLSPAMVKPSRAARAHEYLKHTWRRSAQNPVAAARMVAEMALLRVTTGLAPSDYLLGRLYEKGISWDEKRCYLGAREYEEFVWQFNDPTYRKLSQNKLAEKALLGTLGIPTPEFFGYFNTTAGRDCRGRPLRSGQDLLVLFKTLLEGVPSRKICCKDLEGWAGSGFQALEIQKSESDVRVKDLSTESIAPVSFEEFFRTLGPASDFLIEAYIDQHPAYAAFHPSSINGYRFWVLNLAPGEPVVPFANLRFGRRGAVVDNGPNRIIAPLNSKTGEIQMGYEMTLERREFSAHPDTGAEISGRILPFFTKARQLAIESLAAFPHMNFAGVDIAVSKDGPLVLELNNHPGGMGPLVDRKPMRHIFEQAIAAKRSHNYG